VIPAPFDYVAARSAGHALEFYFTKEDRQKHPEWVGEVGGKLHTARSRNDQVATDVAMFVRAHAHETAASITRLALTLIGPTSLLVYAQTSQWQISRPWYLSWAAMVYIVAAVATLCWIATGRRARRSGAPSPDPSA